MIPTVMRSKIDRPMKTEHIFIKKKSKFSEQHIIY